MPDMERLTRQAELELATATDERAYLRGRHAGEDSARWQVVVLVAALALAAAFATPYMG